MEGKKITNVFQTSFDIGEKEGVSKEQREELVKKITELINKEEGFVHLNGVNTFEDMTDVYPMDEVNEAFR